MKRKRTQEKIITAQTEVLRFVRISRGLSQKQAAILLGVSESAIGHYENGRMEVSPARLAGFLQAYELSFEKFEEYRSGKKHPPIHNLKDECARLLGRIDESKLKAIHSVLMSFVS